MSQPPRSTMLRLALTPRWLVALRRAAAADRRGGLPRPMAVGAHPVDPRGRSGPRCPPIPVQDVFADAAAPPARSRRGCRSPRDGYRRVRPGPAGRGHEREHDGRPACGSSPAFASTTAARSRAPRIAALGRRSGRGGPHRGGDGVRASCSRTRSSMRMRQTPRAPWRPSRTTHLRSCGRPRCCRASSFSRHQAPASSPSPVPVQPTAQAANADFPLAELLLCVPVVDLRALRRGRVPSVALARVEPRRRRPTSSLATTVARGIDARRTATASVDASRRMFSGMMRSRRPLGACLESRGTPHLDARRDHGATAARSSITMTARGFFCR